MDHLYESISKSWGTKFLNSQTDNLTLAARNAVGLSTRFVIGSASIQNRSGGTVVAGIGGRFPVSLWKSGQWTDATTTYTDDTTDAQSAAANDVPLDTVNTNNDGFIVMCQVPFNIVSIKVGTATAGGAPAWDVAYSIAGGTWTTLSNLYVAPDFTSTGEQLVWFEPPTNWAVSEAAHATGISTGYYAIRIRATTAPTVTQGKATLMVLGMIYHSTESITDNIILDAITNNSELWLPPQCDAICAAISTANIQNRITLNYRMVG